MSDLVFILDVHIEQISARENPREPSAIGCRDFCGRGQHQLCFMYGSLSHKVTTQFVMSNYNFLLCKVDIMLVIMAKLIAVLVIMLLARIEKDVETLLRKHC